MNRTVPPLMLFKPVGEVKFGVFQSFTEQRILYGVFVRNNVLVRKCLSSRGVSLPITNPMCNVEKEHLLHLFFDYHIVDQCCKDIGLSCDMWEVEDAMEWLIDNLATVYEEVTCAY